MPSYSLLHRRCQKARSLTTRLSSSLFVALLTGPLVRQACTFSRPGPPGRQFGLWPVQQRTSDQPANDRLRRLRQRAEVLTSAPASGADMVSPFEEGGLQEGKPTLPLTWENVEGVLDELRPYLRSDGGDCKIVEIEGPIVRLELQGSCSSCSSSSVTLKMGIERTLLERIPEIAEVIAVMPDQEPLTEEGIEEVLNGIRPFLSVSGGTIEVQELTEGMNPRLLLQMTGPPLKSTAVRVEVLNRIKRKFPLLQDVDISGEEGDSPPFSA